MEDKQLQKAGDNSRQYQANNITVYNNNGIDEERAREICNEMFEVARKDMTKEATVVAQDRIKSLENILIPKMMKIENSLNVFSDPSFQFLLTDAQKSAAATEQEADYELLSELLIHRIQKSEDRKVYAGIRQAINVVDEVSYDALHGLTISYVIKNIRADTESIIAGLDTLDNLFLKLDTEQLPIGKEWLEHLDILNAIRISPFGEFKKIKQYIPELYDGYVSVGIKKDSDTYKEVEKLLSDVDLSSKSFLIEHELREGYVRLPLKSKSNISKLEIITPIEDDRSYQESKISNKQIKVLENIYDLYEKNQDLKNENIERFMQEWDKRYQLKQVHDWCDNIPEYFKITPVGRVLAHANAQRCYSKIPALN